MHKDNYVNCKSESKSATPLGFFLLLNELMAKASNPEKISRENSGSHNFLK
jgi:hypothetical protein